MELYRWQKKCIEAWEGNGRRGVVRVVTGAGKTVMALAAAASCRDEYPNLRIRVVVPTIPLARQWMQSLMREAGELETDRPGLYGGDRRDNPDRRVMVYVVNSARTVLSAHMRMDFALGRPALLICDECHHYQSRENRKIFDFSMDEMQGSWFALGLSATPFDVQEDQLLRRVFGKEIYHYDYRKAVKEEVISSFIVGQIGVSFLAEENRQYAVMTEKIRILMARLLKAYPYLKGLSGADFMKAVTKLAKAADMDPGDLSAAFLLATYERKRISVLAEARNRCCIDLLNRVVTEERTLVFCERISQAETLYRELSREYGSYVGIYHSEMIAEARERTMKAFRENRVRILVSCRCLDEGIDVPDASVGIVMSSSAVPRQRIQRLGRIIRRSRDKDTACLYYLYIRESTDDRAYLEGLEECETFDLRYYSAEREFAGDVYEYAGLRILERAQSLRSEEECREIRRCLVEGLGRADYLLEEKIQLRNAGSANSVHEKNYWMCMRLLGREVRGD